VSLALGGILDYPRIFAVLSVVVLWLSAQFGVSFHRRRPLQDAEREDFGVVQTATLTLLGLIIGFTFSMAIVRYDLRKHYEEEEANAIGTEYFRAGLLSDGDAALLRFQLRKYLGLRIAFYHAGAGSELRRINTDTAQLQTEMWHSVETPARAQETPVKALVVSGMNDVLNSQGYTQAAWWNRIPVAAWGLLAFIAIGCNFLVGYGAHGAGVRAGLLIVLPLIVATSFLLIADIDCPYHGLIHVIPQNLISLSESLRTR
jgi:hypothetical protein